MGLLTFGVILILVATVIFLNGQKPTNQRDRFLFWIMGTMTFTVGTIALVEYGKSIPPTKSTARESVQTTQKQYLEAQKLYMEWR